MPATNQIGMLYTIKTVLDSPAKLKFFRLHYRMMINIYVRVILISLLIYQNKQTYQYLVRKSFHFILLPHHLLMYVCIMYMILISFLNYQNR